MTILFDTEFLPVDCWDKAAERNVFKYISIQDIRHEIDELENLIFPKITKKL